MIVTVTPNPSFDRTLHTGSFEIGMVNRATGVTVEGSGKGINVSRALAMSGVASTCVFPSKLDDAARMESLSEHVDGFVWHAVDTGTAVRTNVTIIDDAGRTTKVNEPGDTFDAAQQEQLLAAVADVAAGADWLVGCGSLPPGISSDFYRLLAEQGQATGLRMAIDASGDALKAAVDGKAALIKPNRDELADVVGRELETLGEVVDAAIEVRDSGVGGVVVSLGSSGAVLVDDTGIVHGVAPTSEVRNTVGAGDGFFAGFLAAGGVGPDALASALSFGRAAVHSPSTAFDPATDEDRAAVSLTTDIDRSLPVGHE